jgi:GT2 family glycosyltransferase
VGGSAFRVKDGPGFVDTVPFGTFRKSIFNEVGYFDERLTRNQDNEFNARLRRKGYKIAYDPSIKVYYKNQATLKGLIRQAFFTGKWNVYTLFLYPYTFQWRRFIPCAFILYLFSLVFSSFFLSALLVTFYSLPLFAYILLAVTASYNRNYGFKVNSLTGMTFLCYHLTYGMGTCFGIVNLVFGTWEKHLGKAIKR